MTPNKNLLGHGADLPNYPLPHSHTHPHLSSSCPTPTSAIDQELSAVFNWLDEVDCPCRQWEAQRGIGDSGKCVCVSVCVSQWKHCEPFRLSLRTIIVMKWKSAVQKTTDPLINWQVKETNNLKCSFLVVVFHWPGKNALFFFVLHCICIWLLLGVSELIMSGV